jgi:hypothetical protein
MSAKLRKRVCVIHACMRLSSDKTHVSFQIHFINRHYDRLADELGEQCLPKQLGGKLPVDFVDGKLLGDFLKLFDKQFDRK